MPITDINKGVKEKLMHKPILVTSDHGYDVFIEPEGLKISHGTGVAPKF